MKNCSGEKKEGEMLSQCFLCCPTLKIFRCFTHFLPTLKRRRENSWKMRNRERKKLRNVYYCFLTERLQRATSVELSEISLSWTAFFWKLSFTRTLTKINSQKWTRKSSPISGVWKNFYFINNDQWTSGEQRSYSKAFEAKFNVFDFLNVPNLIQRDSKRTRCSWIKILFYYSLRLFADRKAENDENSSWFYYRVDVMFVKYFLLLNWIKL